ncbi:hypothetical protein KIPB_009021 [Kipferlia bialata]|uniref:Transmembrane protein 107 n=1 Tax=Kipferlia bialata TaxID=797122 RepID=A0A9K3GLT4_9EUKA|nr:hypothetical protein KIPB_009021 [Kipferlia bialata]|eukprot:g9021.t1
MSQISKSLLRLYFLLLHVCLTLYCLGSRDTISLSGVSDRCPDDLREKVASSVLYSLLATLLVAVIEACAFCSVSLLSGGANTMGALGHAVGSVICLCLYACSAPFKWAYYQALAVAPVGLMEVFALLSSFLLKKSVYNRRSFVKPRHISGVTMKIGLPEFRIRERLSVMWYRIRH